MATVSIVDDAIWVKHIEDGAALQDRIRTMAPGEKLDLEIAGVRGRWERMRNGRDGRPTFGIRPLSQMREQWARWRAGPSRMVPIREVSDTDTYLAAVGATLTEWDSPEDELAYRDL